MTGQEQKETLAVLLLELNDLIQIATNTYNLGLAMLRNCDSKADFRKHFPDLCEMVGKTDSQNRKVQGRILELIARVA